MEVARLPVRNCSPQLCCGFFFSFCHVASYLINRHRHEEEGTEVSQGRCESVNGNPGKESALLVLYPGPEGIHSFFLGSVPVG